MIDFKDLDDGLANAGRASSAKKVDTREKFPCQTCVGTGKYRGVRVHQEKSECFACGGRGFFYTSLADRMKRRADAQKRKTNKLEAAQAALNEANPGFIDLLRDMSWSDIGRDMLRQYNERGALTENQVAAIYRIAAKAAETKAKREAEKLEAQAARTSVVDLSPIHAMFDKARENGLSKLAYRAEGLVLTPAKASGRNPGAIYVKSSSGDYMGKVVGTSFIAVSSAPATIKPTLEAIAANPSEVAKAYGKKTGICSCCGRELTDPSSIAAGIGPICATKWEF